MYQIQKGEEIGVVDRDNFEAIICNLTDQFEDITCSKVNKSNRKRDATQEHTDPEIALKKSRLSGDHFKSNNADSQKNRRWN